MRGEVLDLGDRARRADRDRRRARPVRAEPAVARVVAAAGAVRAEPAEALPVRTEAAGVEAVGTAVRRAKPWDRVGRDPRPAGRRARGGATAPWRSEPKSSRPSGPWDPSRCQRPARSKPSPIGADEESDGVAWGDPLPVEVASRYIVMYRVARPRGVRHVGSSAAARSPPRGRTVPAQRTAPGPRRDPAPFSSCPSRSEAGLLAQLALDASEHPGHAVQAQQAHDLGTTIASKIGMDSSVAVCP